MSIKVTQIALGRFHHFHLARQLEKRDRLHEIWSGYPAFKLKDEQGIEPPKIKSFPWFYVPAQFLPRFPIIRSSPSIQRELHWQAINAIDRHVAKRIKAPTVLVGLSSGGLYSGQSAQQMGGFHVCDRGSTHIRFQDSILHEEYRRWNMEFAGVDPRVVEKEEAEYDNADRITVPSQFCYKTFVEAGVPAEKMRIIPYGGRLDRFAPTHKPEPDQFTAIFVGDVSIRKGIAYLLQAFAKLKHPHKRLKIIGSVAPDTRPLLMTLPLDHVEILGAVPNTQLAYHYSSANVMLLPSIEEGFGMVMAEAMACGCPVIASGNTGALDLFSHGEEGYIVPARSVDALVEAMDAIVQDREAAETMRDKARARILSLGGYDRYGGQWAELLDELDQSPTIGSSTISPMTEKGSA